MQNSGSPASPGSPESGQPSLEDLFRQLDADSSGNISRKELEHAMKLMYGKPLKAKVIDKMMYDADNDGDGEISYPEFVLMMGACEKQQLESIKLERTMGLWFSIRERGLMPTREQKASRDMTQRRLAAESKRRTAVEKALAEVALRYPPIKFPEWPAPLPDGGGLPPPSQVQQVNVLAPPSPQDRTYDIKASLRRLRVQFGQSADRKTKRKDLESGMIFDADDVADIGCLARWWASLPGPGEAIAIIFDFFDSYAPLIAIMIVPTTWLIKQINALIRPVLDELAGIPPDYVAPPPPPASPDVMQAAVKSFFDLAQAEPATYLALDLGLAFAIGALAFFWKDIMDWLEARRLRAAANAKKAAASGDYQQLENEEEEEEEVMSAQALRMDLYKCINVSEELEIKLRVYKSRGSDAATRELTVQLEEQQAKRVELEKLLKEIGGAEEEEASAKPAQATAKSEFSIFMNNMSAGIVEVTVYFADIISDVQVLMLLYNTGNVVSAALSLLFLIAQFFVIYIRVLPYLSTTFGKESYIYLIYLWTGFPIGSLGLDVLMFLEPFGLLAVLPLPTWLKTFVPSYKATRVICEVFIESLPQTLLQSYILIAVMGRVHAGTAGPNDIALLPNVASLPQSITISTLSTLKTWIGLVDEANKAGISIKAKAWQLWNVGGGLPLDALKKGAIDTWTCGYKLDDGEISPLINALEDNASLVTLNLAASGMTWDQEDSSGAPLVAAIASNPTALAGLQTLIISERTECKLPIDQMRMGGSTAMNSLQTMEFFKPGGPWHDEVLLLGEVLRRDRQVTVFPESAKKAGEKIIKLMEEVSSGHVTREAWELRVKQFMVEGHARRSHLQSLISIEVLRGVSFGAKELHDGGISLSQLRAGCFTVSELKADIGVEVRTLKDLGYSLQEMREGSVTAEELKPFGYSAGEMREGTFVPPELKSAGYTLAEMKEAGFSATDLKTAEFTATQLRKVGYKAAHCRKAEYKPTEMRTAKFTAVEMRDGGFSATKIRMAGYDAAEATTAFDLVTLKEAGYVSRELREAGHSVSDMSGVGFTLEELYGGGYSVEALRGFGFTMAELKAVGASLAKMKESGATVGQLRGAGYTAARLKTQDYSALEMMDGGFTSTDMEKAGFDSRLIKELLNGKTTAEALKEEGFSAKELRAGNFKAADLKGCFPVKVLRAVGYSETNLRDAGFEEWLIESVSGQSTGELRANGFTADQLKTAGYSGSELAEGGYTASELQASGFSASELRLAGLSATLLREAGCSLKELKAAYYSVGELQEAEFTDSELRAAGFTASEFYESDVSAVTLRAVGFSVEELKSGGFSAKDIKGPGQWDKSVLRDLKNANFSAKELKNSGLTAAELRSVDFTVKELEAAGFGGKELKAAGFNGADLRSVGFQAGGLKAVGYTAGELKAGGFSVQELKDGGFGANDLRVAKISPIELKAAGFTAAQLRSEGFSAKELTGGFTSAELKAVGYSARELHQGGIYYPEIKAIGFTAQELRNEGFSPKELRLCGFLARELRNIGCTLAELTAGEYPPLVVQAVDGRSSIALKGDGFTAEILWTAGFSAKELKEALFDAVLLKSVGYSAEDMRKGGFPLRVLLRDAAYTSVELKGAGFSATDFLAAPCSVTELKGAGFSATQCVEAGLNQAVVAAIYRRRTQKERKALQRTGAHWLTLIRNEGFTCEQAKNGGLLPSDCHQAGYSYEEARALGFSRRIDDWVTMDIKNPYNKWG